MYYIYITLFCICCVSVVGCEQYLKNNSELCLLQDEYLSIKDEFKTEYGVDIDFLTGYRALRVIHKDHWEARKKDFQCQPWKFYSPKPKTWLLWERGDDRLTFLVNQSFQTNKMPKLTPELMQDLHLHTVDESILGLLARAKGAMPGKIRSLWYQVSPGCKISCDEAVVDENAKQVLENYDLRDEKGEPLISARLYQCGLITSDKNHYYGVVKYMGSTGVKNELSRMMDNFNSHLTNLVEGKSEDIDALDIIADMQRHFISIHPFGDGNGRVSRFLQDYYTQMFKLPFLPSGALQMDIYVNRDKYRSLIHTEMNNSLDLLKKCLNEYRTFNTYEELTCDCRLLYSDNQNNEKIKKNKKSYVDNTDCLYQNNSTNGELLGLNNHKMFTDILSWMLKKEFMIENSF